MEIGEIEGWQAERAAFAPSRLAPVDVSWVWVWAGERWRPICAEVVQSINGLHCVTPCLRDSPYDEDPPKLEGELETICDCGEQDEDG